MTSQAPHHSESARRLQDHIEHAAHLLPSQGPIEVFVHHNTLHAFEELPFETAVEMGGKLFESNTYLTENQYRELLKHGRIQLSDLEVILNEEPSENRNSKITSFATTTQIKLAMLQYPIVSQPTEELHWLIAESDALQNFRADVPVTVREKLSEETRHWVMRDQRIGKENTATSQIFDQLFERFDKSTMESWSEQGWDSFILNLLWEICHDAAVAVKDNRSRPKTRVTAGRRHRNCLLDATGVDADLLVNESLIRVTSAFLDQGFADWKLPDRDAGLFDSFLELYSQPFVGPTRWFEALKRETIRIRNKQLDPSESITESLELLGVTSDEQEAFILESLIALRGWAGMLWQMETNAEWMPHPAPQGSLVEFLAVRLILDRIAVKQVAKDALGYRGPLNLIRDVALENTHQKPDDGIQLCAFQLFQLAQIFGWKPERLLTLKAANWSSLVEEIELFTESDRRRIFHLAYERKYRNETFDAVISHTRRLRTNSQITKTGADGDSEHDTECVEHDFNSFETTPSKKPLPDYQVICCIDDREESFRRHLEEIDPTCETFGLAGFFGVAMFYRGSADAHFKPLCPVSSKPTHYIIEEPLYSLREAEQFRSEARRRIGHMRHRTHRESRTFLGGIFTGIFGSLAAFPLVARVLFPRATARLRYFYSRLVGPPTTELHLERQQAEPGSQNGQVGYTIEEMANIVEEGMRAIGRAESDDFARLIIMCGHGSSSLNNPHESAYNCGACSGARGGPNARAFSQMANDPRVRQILKERGYAIPDTTAFVGCYHNTCDDSLTWFDLDQLPVQHRHLFEHARRSLDETRCRNAHERCRRFESAALTLTPDEALKHVEARSQDLSEARPEYNHATNALCFVGRRQWSRGLFLDRRAFLTSYDPGTDDHQNSILTGLLQAAIPVCAGISLEYYFSTVDSEQYGCGSKLPHNITSLLGVMSGAASDLRPGLSAQMVEIHEPMRIVFIIETTPEAMQQIIDANPLIARLVHGQWVHLAVFDAESASLKFFRQGEFVPYQVSDPDLPVVSSSLDWYRGWRDHLGFASIVTPSYEELTPTNPVQASNAVSLVQ